MVRVSIRFHGQIIKGEWQSVDEAIADIKVLMKHKFDIEIESK